MNILILEDDPNRIELFLAAFSKNNIVSIAKTAKEAIDILGQMSFKEIYLDHDLGLQQYVSEADTNTGSEVVRWMVKNKDLFNLDVNPLTVIVHSHNTPAAESMESKLRSADFDVYRISFRDLCNHGFGV